MYKRLTQKTTLERQKFYVKLHKILCKWFLDVMPFLQIDRKSKESNEIDRLGRRKFVEIQRRWHWPSVPLSHRRFDRVSVGCRARDRVDPEGGRR